MYSWHCKVVFKLLITHVGKAENLDGYNFKTQHTLVFVKSKTNTIISKKER